MRFFTFFTFFALLKSLLFHPKPWFPKTHHIYNNLSYVLSIFWLYFHKTLVVAYRAKMKWYSAFWRRRWNKFFWDLSLDAWISKNLWAPNQGRVKDVGWLVRLLVHGLTLPYRRRKQLTGGFATLKIQLTSKFYEVAISNLSS